MVFYDSPTHQQWLYTLTLQKSCSLITLAPPVFLNIFTHCIYLVTWSTGTYWPTSWSYCSVHPQTLNHTAQTFQANRHDTSEPLQLSVYETLCGATHQSMCFESFVWFLLLFSSSGKCLISIQVNKYAILLLYCCHYTKYSRVRRPPDKDWNRQCVWVSKIAGVSSNHTSCQLCKSCKHNQ